jgi:hypothetical protein
MTKRAALLLLIAIPGWAEFRAGRAAVKITPPAGIPMAGYYSTRLAEGVHDDLYAKALVFEQDGRRAAMVACDLVNLPRDVAIASRKAITDSTGISDENIIVSATHSHTGPLLGGRGLDAVRGKPMDIARTYKAALPLKIAEAVRLAAAALVPVQVSAAVGREESVAFYRRFLMKDGTVRTNPGRRNPEIVQPMGQIDPDLALVWIESAGGKPVAAYVNYAMHLDTVGGLQFSADYPHTLAKTLGKVFGPDLLTIFTIGAAGNINHIDVKSGAPQKGHAEARRIGTVLAGEAIKVTTHLAKVDAFRLAVAGAVVELPLPEFTKEEVTHARAVAAKFGQPDSPGTQPLAAAFRILDVADRNGQPVAAEVRGVALGRDLAFVALPGEIFVELGQAIKKASPFRTTIIVELAGPSIGYVPTRKAFTEGSYEVLSARFAPGGGEMIADAAIRLLADLYR